MSAKDKDTEEVEEASPEEKPKRRGLRSRAKEGEETSAEAKPKRGRRGKGKGAPDDADADVEPTTSAKPAAEAAAQPKGEAKPKAVAKKAAAKPKVEGEEKSKPDSASVAEAEADATPEGEKQSKPPAKPKPAAADKSGGAAAELPARSIAAPRRATREPGAAPAVVRAHAKYVRTSARKARLVCDHIRGKSVDEARAILAFAPRAAARDWGKLLESAVANAEHNHELIGDDLRIKDVYADEGPTLKRYRPRAMGRATRIRKRTSHLTITLTPKENA